MKKGDIIQLSFPTTHDIGPGYSEFNSQNQVFPPAMNSSAINLTDNSFDSVEIECLETGAHLLSEGQIRCFLQEGSVSTSV